MSVSSVMSAALVCFTLSVPATTAHASSLAEPQRTQAQRLAETTAWQSDISTVSPRSGSPAFHPLGIQTLTVEKQENKRQPDSPLLQVYQFHYALELARRLVVNPELNSVISIQPVQSVHLPLNEAEIAYASGLLQLQPQILDSLRQEQIKRGKVPFEQLAMLDVKASIYEPLSTTHTCHRQRCVLLSLFDDTRTVFSTEPIVNLQTLQVDLLEVQ